MENADIFAVLKRLSHRFTSRLSDEEKQEQDRITHFENESVIADRKEESK